MNLSPVFSTITSSMWPFAGVASRKRRSASLSDGPNLSQTSECKGETDSDQRVVTESRQQILQEAESEVAVETWKKRALEAERRLRSLEAEASRHLAAKQATCEQQAQEAATQVSEAEDRANVLQAGYAQLQQELRHTKDELRKKVALLDTRSAELRDTQAYLTRLDDVADAEVLQLVGGINSRIFQVAASIADTFESRYGELEDRRMSHEGARHLEHLVGGDLLSALSSVDHAPDPLVVQAVLQAVMVSFTGFLCDKWAFRPSERSSFAQHLYYLMRQTGTHYLDTTYVLTDKNLEQQSVAGRWRALCFTYMKKFFADDAERRHAAKDELLERITDTLIASGVSTPPQDLFQEVARSHADDVLREIIRLSHEFQSTTIERIISRDIWVGTVHPGKPFDPSEIVDEWADPKKARSCVNIDPVLCTTQLGVVRAERRASEGSGGEGEISHTVLLKPKVVLTSFLEELLAETGSGSTQMEDALPAIVVRTFIPFLTTFPMADHTFKGAS